MSSKNEKYAHKMHIMVKSLNSKEKEKLWKAFRGKMYYLQRKKIRVLSAFSLPKLDYVDNVLGEIDKYS